MLDELTEMGYEVPSKTLVIPQQGASAPLESLDPTLEGADLTSEDLEDPQRGWSTHEG